MVRKGKPKEGNKKQSEKTWKGSHSQRHSEEEEEEEEVFDLSAPNEESEESEGSGEENSDDSEEHSQRKGKEYSKSRARKDTEDIDADEEDSDDSEEESDEDYSRTDLDQLVDNLPADLRQRVRMGKTEDDDEDEEDDMEEGDDSLSHTLSGWGKKSNYYSGDTADLEIGQDQADAEDEEAAANELRKEQLSKRQERDYDDSEAKSDSDIEESEPSKALNKQLNQLSTQTTGHGKVMIEKIQRDISKLSKKQRLEILKSEAPEMLGLVDELNEKLKDLQERVEPMRASITSLLEKGPVEDELCLYLQVKQQLLLSYCVNIIFYLMLRAEGRSVQSHPVMKQLLKLRYAMEKMRALDGKMKHQIDRLLSISDSNDTGKNISGGFSTSSSRPNISALLQSVDDDDKDSEEDGKQKKILSKEGIYRAPKSYAVPYKDEKDLTQLEEKIQRKQKKIKNSELLETLREEFGQAPEQTSSSGLGKLSKEHKQIDDEIEERRKFEEERFVRLTLSKKDKKALKKRREMTFDAGQELVGDMGDIDDLESLTTLTNNLQSIEPSSSSTLERISKKTGVNSDTLTTALKKAVSVFTNEEKAGKGKGKKSKEKKIRGGDEEDFDAGNMRASMMREREVDNDNDCGDDFDGVVMEREDLDERPSNKRRRAPELFNDEEASPNLLEEFSQKKKQYLDQKRDHYTATQRVGGHEDLLDDPESKRAASYEIMANRGLRPHRKKSNRNPRVKKREAYDKAVLKRKSQVRDVVQGSTMSYGGELTGIKANLSRSRRFNS